MVNRLVSDSLRQLAAFWHRQRTAAPQILGYGAIVCFLYGNTPQITVFVIEPQDQDFIQAQAAALTTGEFEAAFGQAGQLRGALHNVP